MWSAKGLPQVRIFRNEVKFVEFPLLYFVVDRVHKSGLLLGALGPAFFRYLRTEESLVIDMHGSHHLPRGKLLVESDLPNAEANFF